MKRPRLVEMIIITLIAKRKMTRHTIVVLAALSATQRLATKQAPEIPGFQPNNPIRLSLQQLKVWDVQGRISCAKICMRLFRCMYIYIYIKYIDRHAKKHTHESTYKKYPTRLIYKNPHMCNTRGYSTYSIIIHIHTRSCIYTYIYICVYIYSH